VWGRGMRNDTTTMNEDDKNPAISGSGLHLEQSIKVTGTVRFDNHTVTLDAVGHRDHSCGPRARSNQWRVAWGERLVPERADIPRSQRLGRRPADLRTRLRLGRLGHGEHRRLRRPGTDRANRGAAGIRGQLRDRRGGRSCLRGELLGSMPTTGYMPQGATVGAEPVGHVAIDGPARWSWDGEVGYGWAQRTWIRGGWDEVRERDRRRVRASRLA